MDACEPTGVADSVVKAPTRIPKHPLRILLAEHNDDDVVLFRHLISKVFCDVPVHLARVTHSREALEQLQQASYDLLFIGNEVGSDSGLDLLCKARGQGISTPVVFLTSQGDEALLAQTMKGGACDYVPKSKLNETSLSQVVRYGIKLRKAQEELRRLNRALLALSKCNHAVMHAVGESELVDTVSRIVVDFGGYQMAWVGYADTNVQKTVHSVALAGHDEGYVSSVRIGWGDNEFGRGPVGSAIRSGQVVVVRHLRQDENSYPWRDMAVARGYASIIALPLTSEGKPFGSLNIYSAEPDAFDSQEQP